MHLHAFSRPHTLCRVFLITCFDYTHTILHRRDPPHSAYRTEHYPSTSHVLFFFDSFSVFVVYIIQSGFSTLRMLAAQSTFLQGHYTACIALIYSIIRFFTTIPNSLLSSLPPLLAYSLIWAPLLLVFESVDPRPPTRRPPIYRLGFWVRRSFVEEGS